MNTSNTQPTAVLVVEDNPNDVLLLQHAATEVCPDITFHFRPNAATALAHLADGHHTQSLPHLVLLDYTLPDMDGLQLLHRLRATPTFQPLWVLLWTGDPDPELKARAFQAGANGFVMKVTSYDSLLEVMVCIALDARARAAFAP